MRSLIENELRREISQCLKNINENCSNPVSRNVFKQVSEKLFEKADFNSRLIYEICSRECSGDYKKMDAFSRSGKLLLNEFFRFLEAIEDKLIQGEQEIPVELKKFCFEKFEQLVTKLKQIAISQRKINPKDDYWAFGLLKRKRNVFANERNAENGINNARSSSRNAFYYSKDVRNISNSLASDIIYAPYEDLCSNETLRSSKELYLSLKLVKEGGKIDSIVHSALEMEKWLVNYHDSFINEVMRELNGLFDQVLKNSIELMRNSDASVRYSVRQSIQQTFREGAEKIIGVKKENYKKTLEKDHMPSYDKKYWKAVEEMIKLIPSEYQNGALYTSDRYWKIRKAIKCQFSLLINAVKNCLDLEAKKSNKIFDRLVSIQGKRILKELEKPNPQIIKWEDQSVENSLNTQENLNFSFRNIGFSTILSNDNNSRHSYIGRFLRSKRVRAAKSPVGNPFIIGFEALF